MTSKQQHTQTRIGAHQSGFTLLTVLIAVSTVAAMVAAYGRHVIVEGQSSMASTSLFESREACHSGLSFARQALVSGNGLTSGSIPTGSGVVTISVSDLPLGNQAVEVESVGANGYGVRRTFEMGIMPVPASAPDGPSALPTLSSATVEELLGNSSLTIRHYTHSTSLQGVELSGLFVVHEGVELVLDDVVLKGAIVSAAVMEQSEIGDYDSSSAPHVLVVGNVRLDAHPSLPGVAVLMPDGAFESEQVGARLQIHGDIVVHDISLNLGGTLSGNIAAVNQELPEQDVLQRAGSDRRAPDWSSELQLGGAQDPVFLAAVPPATGELSAIVDFWQN